MACSSSLLIGGRRFGLFRRRAMSSEINSYVPAPRLSLIGRLPNALPTRTASDNFGVVTYETRPPRAGSSDVSVAIVLLGV